MASIIGTNAPGQVSGALKLKSITVTPRDAAIDKVDVFPYANTTGNPLFTVKANAGVTVQVTYGGMDFPDGIAVVPNADCVSYVVEYDR